MRQTWRWFGPGDPISIPEVRMTGAEGVVTALHHIPPGAVWPLEEIRARQAEIAAPGGVASGLAWDVVESLPVSEEIKTQSGDWRAHLDAYVQSLRHLAEAGLRTVCYNFMPVLDWTRTDLAARQPNGGTAMRFDLLDFAAFDLFVLNRRGAECDYAPDLATRAQVRAATLDAAGTARLTRTIVAGLPGANDRWTLGDVRARLAAYEGVTAEGLRAALVDFLSHVVPTAEALGLRLCCHPDDPPFPLLGLPRVMSTQADYRAVMAAVDSPASGITFCTGSLGVDPGFDPVGFVADLGDRIHFAHLRNTRRRGPADAARVSFEESEHLDGDTDMVATVRALMAEEARRRAAGRADHQIPMRPDHGHALATDLERETLPGYPLVGRLRGLAELRGVMAACAAEGR